MNLLSIKNVFAHCDLPCGVYDPAQARIEAESVHGINEKYEGLSQENKWRAVFIKEQRLELVKHHLWVIWTEYCKPDHLSAKPELHDMFWKATKLAGQAKKTTSLDDSQALLDAIAEIDTWFQDSKKA